MRTVWVLAAIATLLVGNAGALAQGPIGPPMIDPAIAGGLDPAGVNDSGLGPAFPDRLDADSSVVAGGPNPLGVLAQAAQAASRMRAGAADPVGETPSSEGEPTTGLSAAINIMLVLTVVTLAPSIVLMTTSFVRVLVVLGLLKQAMGTQTIPPSQVTTALALFMTMLIMGPTVDRVWTGAVVPYQQGEIQSYDELWTRARAPVREFMFDQIEATGNWSSLYMVLEYRGVDVSEPESLTRGDVDMVALIPAFMISELKVAFVMGFRVYLPFLVIDMVIASMLISMSMMMLPPVLISLPFKLLLFVLVDGWTLVVGSLLDSFVQPGELDSIREAGQAMAPVLDGALRAGAPTTIGSG